MYRKVLISSVSLQKQLLSGFDLEAVLTSKL